MANRCNLTNQIETLSGNVSAQTYFDANWNNPVTALNNASLGYMNGIASDTGSANNYILTSVFGVATAYNPGMTYAFLPANSNTGASTLNVDGLGSQSIVDWAGNPILAGVIQAGKLCLVIYISGAFRLLYTTPPGALFYNTVFPSGGGTVTINCAGYSTISLLLDASTISTGSTWTINVTNVLWGAQFMVVILPHGNNQTFKWSGTDQAGTTITPIQAWYPISSTSGNNVSFAASNLITAGDDAPNFIQYNGVCLAKASAPTETLLRFFAMYN
jgi:hypothetical protein